MVCKRRIGKAVLYVYPFLAGLAWCIDVCGSGCYIILVCDCAIVPFSQHLLHSRKIIKSILYTIDKIYYRCYNKNDNDEIKNKKKNRCWLTDNKNWIFVKSNLTIDMAQIEVRNFFLTIDGVHVCIRQLHNLWRKRIYMESLALINLFSKTKKKKRKCSRRQGIT